MFNLTTDQLTSKQLIIDTFKTKNVFLLTGSAGVGKTTLTKSICNYYSELGYGICAIAPTHKAKGVIESILNEHKILPINAFTVASILGKMKEHSYVGTKSYSKANDKKFSVYNLFILDEVSMVADKDLKFIVNYVTKNNKKLLIIGDEYQIPCPSAGYIIDDETIEKENSYIFKESVDRFDLTEIVRQVKDSPIIQLATFVRDNIDVDIDNHIKYHNIITPEEAYTTFVSYYQKNPLSCKMIAYTNQAVKSHNIEIRKALKFESKFVVNDILTGYTNLGYPELIIQNGCDYQIFKVIETKKMKIDGYDNLVGNLIDLMIMGKKIKIPNLFFININHENNHDLINELIARAEKINSSHSTKLDYMKYSSIKNKVIFMEDLYKYNGEIYSESDFKEKHALMFTKLADVIKDGQMIESTLSEKLNTTYYDIINDRLSDDKIIADSETLADRYKVIEKDIYYGYAITAHKSQGSSYDNVVVDDIDFAKIQDRFNYKYDKLEKRIKEKNQLRYVAYTRAKHDLAIII
jgi:nucleoside-triphosphatase THEP1